jgi:Questin oxidase-like
MHLVTSSAFLPSHAALVSPVARARLLHTYLVTALSFYAFLRCPALDVAGFYSATESYMQKDTKLNPWLPLIQDAIEHHDEHITKTQRALAAWSSHFGAKTFNFVPTSSPSIKGLELLDGSLFLKAAQLTTLRVGPPVIQSDDSESVRARHTEWDFVELSAD